MTDAQVWALHMEMLGWPPRARAARIAAFAEAHGKSASTVRKRLGKVAAASAERGRTPADPSTDPDLEAAARAVWLCKVTGDGPVPTETAQQIARSEGLIDRTWPVISLNQAAARLGLNTAAPYVRRMESTHANQAHRVDLSGSRHFQVVAEIPAPPAGEGPGGGEGKGLVGGKDYMLRVVRAEQRNKRWKLDASGALLWLLVAIDDYSRVFNARYVVAPGESADLVQRFLVDTWRNGFPIAVPSPSLRERGSGGEAPRGLPEMLICDQGSFGKDQTTRALLHFFAIDLVLGMPHNSQRNGRVERPIRSLKERFERAYLVTHGVGGQTRLSSLQEELQAFVRTTNERRHPIRPDRTKVEDWQRSIGFRALRECPEDALRLAVWREARTVDKAGWVQHGNRLLEIMGLPFGMRGRTVVLAYNRAGEIVAEHDGRVYPVRVPQPIRLGEYSSESLRGRVEPPAVQLAREAEARPKSEVALFDARRQAVLAAAGEPPVAPGMPVRQSPSPLAGEGRGGGVEARPRIVAPAPRLRAATENVIPFDRPRVFGSLEEARRAFEEALGKPIHAVPRLEEIRGEIERVLVSFGLDRGRTLDFAAELKAAAGL